MAVGILGVLTMSGATLIYYSSTNGRSADLSSSSANAYDLAEAGVNEIMAVLSKPENNSLNPYLLGWQGDTDSDGQREMSEVELTSHEYEAGTVEWGGVLDESTATWTIEAVGRIRNPTGASQDVMRRLTAKVPVTPVTTQPLNNPSWNYVYSTRTGNVCDMTLDNTVELRTRIYVAGNLCLKQSAKINGGSNVALVVQGALTQYSSQNRVGQPTGTGYGPLAEAHVGNGCKWFNNASHDPCQAGAGASGYDELYAGVLSDNPQVLAKPVADWDAWYANASPGPYYPCSLVNTGTPPTFDNDQGSSASPDPTKRNTSVPGTFNLTPASSYSCKTAAGELTWDATSKTLTVSGTIFIDGYAKVENGATNQYNGQGTLYLSGTFLIKNSELCGGVSGSDCAFSAWNPNTEMLTIVANGSGGQTDVGVSVSIEVKSAQFQGALYGTNAVQLDTSSKADGPMVGSEVVLGQSITTDDFETIITVPAGMPGNPAVYAQPNPPQLYSG